MKYTCINENVHNPESPSVWREWIEMKMEKLNVKAHMSPSVWREWIEIFSRHGMPQGDRSLPPCGGSGLKFVDGLRAYHIWGVSLRVEGVD